MWKQKYLFSYNSSWFFFLLKTLTFSCLISFFSSFMWLSQVFRLFCKKSFQLYPGSCRLSGDSHSISFQCYHHSSIPSFPLLLPFPTSPLPFLHTRSCFPVLFYALSSAFVTSLSSLHSLPTSTIQ